MQLRPDIGMNLDLMIKKRKQSDMKLYLRQYIRDISKEIIALNIEKD